MRVLVADDHLLFRDGITSLLDAAGIEVVDQAGDGLSAVEKALNLRPDLVLMDISMPHMSGLEALSLIKEQLPETQVVLLSVSESDSDLQKAIEAGADGYLLKNLNAEEFADMLDGLQRSETTMIKDSLTQLRKGLTGPSQLTPK